MPLAKSDASSFGRSFHAQRLSSAAAAEERSDEDDVGWNELLGVIPGLLKECLAYTVKYWLEECRIPRTYSFQFHNKRSKAAWIRRRV
ncbi:MAG: hypothetical protein WCJ18_00450 [Planctomycetota bacterium]